MSEQTSFDRQGHQKLNIILRRLVEHYDYSPNNRIDMSNIDSDVNHFCDKLVSLIDNFTNRITYFESDSELDYNSSDEESDCDTSFEDLDQAPSTEKPDLDQSFSKSGELEPSVRRSWTSGKDRFTDRQIRIYDEMKEKAKSRSSIRSYLNMHEVDFKALEEYRRRSSSGSTSTEKYQQIDTMVFEKFKQKRAQLKVVKDLDLAIMIREAVKVYNPPRPCNSYSFIHRFKKRHHIVSRKITRFTSVKSQMDDAKIKEDAEQFVKKVNHLILIDGYSPNNIWNTDQSRFEYEMTYGRTLEIEGTEEITAATAGSSQYTHSYSVQIHISMAGKLGKKMYIVFQEYPGGKFGPMVQKKVDKLLEDLPNLVVTSTTSGKLHKENMGDWAIQCFKPDFKKKCLLLLDSWGGHNDHLQIKTKVGCKKKNLDDLHIETIPPRTTRYIQPLDVYFFRLFKSVCRVLFEHARNLYRDEQREIFKPTDRFFAMVLLSLVYHQFSCPLLKPMIQYAWIKSGYEGNINYQPFEYVNKLFFKTLEDCECGTYSIIRCVYCSKCLCMEHFFVKNHTHYDAL